LGAKRLEMLRELMPKLSLVSVLLNAASPFVETELNDIQAAAHAVGQKLLIIKVRTEGDIDVGFTTIVQHRAGALVIGADPFFLSQRNRLVTLAAHHSVPTIFPVREGVEAGGLMSYGPNNTEVYRQLGIYVGRILKGANPADLPVQQATKVEFVINLKTAKTLGLTFPITLLGRADEVIE
jgi:putative ABC transport system substrate-binding protein